jgi:hypothetical protein
MTVLSEMWYTKGKNYRAGGPCSISYHPNGVVKEKIWFEYDWMRRYGGPVIIKYSDVGVILKTLLGNNIIL